MFLLRANSLYVHVVFSSINFFTIRLCYQRRVSKAWSYHQWKNAQNREVFIMRLMILFEIFCELVYSEKHRKSPLPIKNKGKLFIRSRLWYFVFWRGSGGGVLPGEIFWAWALMIRGDIIYHKFVNIVYELWPMLRERGCYIPYFI